MNVYVVYWFHLAEKKKIQKERKKFQNATNQTKKIYQLIETNQLYLQVFFVCLFKMKYIHLKNNFQTLQFASLDNSNLWGWFQDNTNQQNKSS